MELMGLLSTLLDGEGDTMTGQLKGITPVSANDLTRKDYVDTKLSGSGPAFHATLSAPQSISPASFRKVNFDVETFDTNSCFAGYAFTPNVAGYYQINGGVMGTLSSSNPYLSISLCFQRGSTIVSETRAESTSATSFTWSNYATLSDVIYMNGTTDALTMYVRGEYTFNIGTQYNEHMTFFSGSLIRAA